MIPLLILLGACFVDVSLGNGRLVDPPMRSYMWRVGFNTPKNYDDHTLTCGGFERQHDAANEGRCGVCGDPWDGERQNEAGGKFAKGVITREYTAGSDVTMTIEMLAPRGGYFELRLCPVSNPSTAATQECLDRHPLEILNGQGTRYAVDGELLEHHGIYDLTVRLPADVTCDQCVIQWKYHAGNEWGYNPDGRMCRGCGPQFEQYNCADVRINRRSGNAAIRANPSRITEKEDNNDAEQTVGGDDVTTPKVFTFERDSMAGSDTNSPPFSIERDFGLSGNSADQSDNEPPTTQTNRFQIQRDSIVRPNGGPAPYPIVRDSVDKPDKSADINPTSYPVVRDPVGESVGSTDTGTDKNPSPFNIVRDTFDDSAVVTNVDGSVNPSPTPYGAPSIQESNSPDVVFSDLTVPSMDNSIAGSDSFIDLIPSDPAEATAITLPSPTPYVPVPSGGIVPDDFFPPPSDVLEPQISNEDTTSVPPGLIIRDAVFDNGNADTSSDQLPEKVFIPDIVIDNLPENINDDTVDVLGSEGQSKDQAELPVESPVPTYSPDDATTRSVDISDVGDREIEKASAGDEPAKDSDSASLPSEKVSTGSSSKSSSKASTTGITKKVHIKANSWGQNNAWATYMNRMYQQRMAAYLASQVWGNRGQWGTGTTWGAGNGAWGAGNGAWGAGTWPTSTWGAGTTWGGNWGNNWNQNSWGNTNSGSNTWGNTNSGSNTWGNTNSGSNTWGNTNSGGNTWGNSNSNSWGNNGNSWNSQTGNSWGNSQSSLASHLPTCGSNQRLVCQGLGNFVNDAQTKQYCNQNCPTGGRCPQNICSCSCAYSQSLDCRYKTNGIALPSNHQWCNSQCNSGACPAKYCECSTISNW